MAKQKKETPINLANKTKVVATSRSKYMIVNKEYEIQSELAERLAKQGKVVIRR
jgi:hypothetical protein